MWGAYWNWDPRQTSIVLALLFYAAYLALRAAVEDAPRPGGVSPPPTPCSDWWWRRSSFSCCRASPSRSIPTR